MHEFNIANAMMLKKHQPEKEKMVENELSKFMGDNKHISDELGARAIQGKAYLPGPDDKDEIIENED